MVVFQRDITRVFSWAAVGLFNSSRVCLRLGQYYNIQKELGLVFLIIIDGHRHRADIAVDWMWRDAGIATTDTSIGTTVVTDKGH